LRKLLLDEWDPIGIRRLHGPEDEYDIYLGEILHLLDTNATADELADFLRTVEIGRMGLSQKHTPDRTPVAKSIIALYRSTSSIDAA
jgi:hypothetical protein